MKKKTTPQPRNYLVKLALFRKAGSHKKSNKAIRRLEKSKKMYPIIDITINSVYNRIHWANSLMVKRPTHNRLSNSSILFWPTKYTKCCVDIMSKKCYSVTYDRKRKTSSFLG